MASVRLALVAEAELLHDAIDQIAFIHECLSERHGDRFRDLERRIEDLMEGEWGPVGSEQLEPGRIVLLPPALWLSLIEEARAMGVI